MKDILVKILIAIILIASIVMFVIFGKIIMSAYMFEPVASEDEEEGTHILEIAGENKTVESIEVPKIIEETTVQNAGNEVQYDFNNVQVDKYFYNQLDNYEKYIYNALIESKEDLKSGTATINLGDKLTDLINQSSEALSKSYQSAIEAYFYDNPDVFYLDPNKMYLTLNTKSYSSGKKEYNVYINCGNEPNYFIDEFSSKEEVDNAIAQLEQVRNYLVGHKTGDTYNDIKRIHDYLINSISYDETLSSPNIYNAYGALINRYCVCEGYSRALKYILDSMEIPCVIVVGTGISPTGQQEKHAWNYVQCNGNWYAVDTTWDDPVVRGGARVTEADKVKYFMKGANEFNQTHTASTQFTEGGKSFSYPQIVQ